MCSVGVFHCSCIILSVPKGGEITGQCPSHSGLIRHALGPGFLYILSLAPETSLATETDNLRMDYEW